MSIDALNSAEPLDAGEIVPVCNICGATEFVAFKDRKGERCTGCRSLSRHRVAIEVYKKFGVFDLKDSPPYGTRALHFAPEPALHGRLKDAIGAGYICADAYPELYRKAQCIKLFLPQDIEIFPPAYFDFVLHNHVLEHVPGTFRDHIPALLRVLKPGGRMICSVPGPRMNAETVEGGELLATDEERLEKFGKIDHFKRFGRDLPEFMAEARGGRFEWDGLTTQERASCGAGLKSCKFMIWTKYPAKPKPARRRAAVTPS